MAMRNRIGFTVVCGATLAVIVGCAMSPTVTTAPTPTARQVIVKHSYGSPESTRPAADAACKKFDRMTTAVFSQKLLDSFANQFVFNCVKSQTP